MQVVTPVRRSARKQPPQQAVAALLLETDFSYAPNPVQARPAAAGHGQEQEPDGVADVEAEVDSNSGAADEDVAEEDTAEVSDGACLLQEMPHRLQHARTPVHICSLRRVLVAECHLLTSFLRCLFVCQASRAPIQEQHEHVTKCRV